MSNSHRQNSLINMLPGLFCFFILLIMLFSADVHTNNATASKLDYYPTISQVTIHSQSSGFCYNVTTHFDNNNIANSPTLLTRVDCDGAFASRELLWDFIYIPKTDSVAEQCFETVVLQQEVFPGHDDSKIEVTGMAQISCADLPNG